MNDIFKIAGISKKSYAKLLDFVGQRCIDELVKCITLTKDDFYEKLSAVCGEEYADCYICATGILKYLDKFLPDVDTQDIRCELYNTLKKIGV